MLVQRNFLHRQLLMSAIFAGSVGIGCVGDDFHETVAVEQLSGKSMEEVIRLAGEPDKRTATQLVYRYDTTEKISPIWAEVLLLGAVGTAGSNNLDLSYVDNGYFCLFLNFANGLLVGHSKEKREPSGNC